MTTATPEEIAEIGKALFGAYWVQPMARAFGVHRNTPNKWKRVGAPREAFKRHLSLYLVEQRRAIDVAERFITGT